MRELIYLYTNKILKAATPPFYKNEYKLKHMEKHSHTFILCERIVHASAAIFIGKRTTVFIKSIYKSQ